jgi:hypothetical protein
MPERNPPRLAALSTLPVPPVSTQALECREGFNGFSGNPDTGSDNHGGAPPNVLLDGLYPLIPLPEVHYTVLPAFP